jgi:glucose/arabinose dehydrogenase
MSLHATHRLTAAGALLLAGLLGGCGGDSGDLQGPAPGSSIGEIVLSAPDSSLAAEQTVQVTAEARDTAGAVMPGETFTWASSASEVATVSQDGLVTAVAPGEADITATDGDAVGRLTVAVTAASGPPGGPPPAGGDSVGLELIASGAGFPLWVTSPPGDSRLFIVDKGGAIRIVKDGTLLAEPFLDLTGNVATRPEQGLLGLAFPPDYATSQRFVVHYTNVDGDTRVSFFNTSSDPDRADPASEAVILGLDQPGPGHNGGEVMFGPDGFLWIGLGDGGSRDGDDKGRGQSLADWFGSILRIDVANGPAYTVPPDNPFVGTAGAKPEIWSYGLRNPWRFSFDRSTGDLYIGDVGEHHWEEVNIGTVADDLGRGANYGWSRVEGHECLQAGCDQSGITFPALEYNHDIGGCAITGAYVYRGAAIPKLQGQLLFSDFCGGWVHSVPVATPSATPVNWPTLSPPDDDLISSLAEDNDGELYVTTAGGKVFKIVPR